MDRLQVRRPVAEVLFGVVQDLTGLVGVLEGGTGVAGDDGGVVEQIQEAATVAGEHDLLLGALDGGGEV